MKAVENIHPVDAHVGQRIRNRRKELGFTQSKLADALGLTFQQVQKYERGANRVSASKLWEISDVLEVGLTYFFEDMPTDEPIHEAADEEVKRLLNAFESIADPALRHAVISLAEQLRRSQVRAA